MPELKFGPTYMHLSAPARTRPHLSAPVPQLVPFGMIVITSRLVGVKYVFATR
jgi:hypothetical protein